ncbi:protein Mdm4-like [Choloepus didactylus]|uniref:protein Mdm4-like n=1 Tax=Choloepus didactylus TaxID=27675 RepID=UPI00189E139F|nr:protein Mdm4-like [Choloepus didactylus]
MTSISTSAQCSTSDSACRISPTQIKQVRPKLPLLKILQEAGAQGDMFTVKEVMHYLGQYIMVKQLYDQQEQHMVYCGGDLLGELLGRQSFSVKDPSPLYDMLRKNLVTLATVTTGMLHHISSVRITALSSGGQMMGKQGGSRWKWNAAFGRDMYYLS